ncbi:MmcQ/YjbR family DNA-binding protein [Aeromicrobium terrae]|uniref:MmcQ/YjbR family DNA-binding protein n=1 Tax=Aeromicrobium terrae TaxID=2498846 RepID=A0A5C8NK67_9ACTN|nr:MmcQ/YjbR family DNA-binding protein [Aeromicrobium terrae]TXL60853.1 MmcQ/YjbR family DNA-binding protein [Aeromicrobium terrae]
MAHPVMFSDDDPGLAELRAIALALPGATERISYGRPTFRANKIFAAFGGSEKLSPGNHRQVPSALIFTPDPVDLPAIEDDPRFFVPAYYGPYGGRAIDLAAPDVDWTEIAELVDASYRLVATKRQLAELDARS